MRTIKEISTIEKDLKKLRENCIQLFSKNGNEQTATVNKLKKQIEDLELARLYILENPCAEYVNRTFDKLQKRFEKINDELILTTSGIDNPEKKKDIRKFYEDLHGLQKIKKQIKFLNLVMN